MTSISHNLKFKPKINPEIAGLLLRGALLNMLEFPLYNESDVETLYNYFNAIGGKNTGSYSDYRQKMLFNEEKGYFSGLPTSSIKAGYGFTPFTNKSNIGLLIDPEMVDFVFINSSDSMTSPLDDKNIRIASDFLPVLKELNNPQINERGSQYLPIEGDKISRERLKEFFTDEFFSFYSKRHMPNTKEFKRSIIEAEKEGFSISNEIMVNAPPASKKAIVLHPTTEKHKYRSMNYEVKYSEHGSVYIGACIQAHLLREGIKHKTGNELPIIHYSIKEVYAAPVIKELEIDTYAISHAIKNNNFVKYCYEQTLGKRITNDIMLNRNVSQIYI